MFFFVPAIGLQVVRVVWAFMLFIHEGTVASKLKAAPLIFQGWEWRHCINSIQSMTIVWFAESSHQPLWSSMQPRAVSCVFCMRASLPSLLDHKMWFFLRRFPSGSFCIWRSTDMINLAQISAPGCVGRYCATSLSDRRAVSKGCFWNLPRLTFKGISSVLFYNLITFKSRFAKLVNFITKKSLWLYRCGFEISIALKHQIQVLTISLQHHPQGKLCSPE